MLLTLLPIARAPRRPSALEEGHAQGPDDPMAAIDAIPGLTASEREWICTPTAQSLLSEDRPARRKSV